MNGSTQAAGGGHAGAFFCHSGYHPLPPPPPISHQADGNGNRFPSSKTISFSGNRNAPNRQPLLWPFRRSFPSACNPIVNAHRITIAEGCIERTITEQGIGRSAIKSWQMLVMAEDTEHLFDITVPPRHTGLDRSFPLASNGISARFSIPEVSTLTGFSFW